MPLIDYPDVEELDEETRGMLEGTGDERGGIPSFPHMLANNPAVLGAALGQFGEIMYGGNLEPDLKQLAFVTVSQENECAYCAASHGAELVNAFGLPAAQLEAIAKRDYSELTDRQRAVVEFARQSAVDPKRVSADHVEALRAVGFDDATWDKGPAQLGYGDGDEETVVNSGPENDKFITTYFRHAFDIDNPDAVTALSLNLVRDDGAVVYLNNREVFRSNMPAGDVTYQSTAASVVGGGDESALQQTEMDPARLQEGVNVLAVEIHQVSGTSSDISFDLELTGLVFPQDQPPTVDAGEDRTIPLADSLLLEGNVNDDGLPNPPGLVTIQWEQINGPGRATFAQAGWSTSKVVFNQPGSYQLRLNADDGATVTSDEIIVTVEGEAEDFDSWRTQYFSQSELDDPAISGRDADPDGDGHTNDQEFQTGTHPREANSYFHVEMIERSLDNGTVRFLFQAMPERSYSVEYRNALTEGTWNKLEDIAANAETRQVEVLDLDPAPKGIRYYRIVTPQQP
jgi:uncharacterized peroxidase-related enzyme